MILIRLLVAFSLMVFFGAESWGSELRVSGGGFSHHVLTGSGHDYNESHNLAAVQVERVEVGRFDNSYDVETWYLAYEANRQWGDWQGFIKAGAMYGYVDCLNPGDSSDTSKALCPMLAPGVRYTRYAVQPEVLLFGQAVAVTVSIAFEM